VKELVIRGRTVRADENGLVSLNDIWEAAGFSKNQKPHDWSRLATTQKLIEAVLVRNTGKSRNWAKSDYTSTIYLKRGQGGGTFVDVRLALAYAEYLNPKLALEVREVFLRYKVADATLADDILERAAPEANEWAGVRALTRSTRNKHTAILQDHGVSAPIDFAKITNETYIALFDKPAKSLKAARGLKKNDNLRDKMGLSDLTYIMAAESLANERIEETNPIGATRCQIAVRTSATFIREAIEKDRASRTGSIFD
jgi:hypothetical protein